MNTDALNKESLNKEIVHAIEKAMLECVSDNRTDNLTVVMRIVQNIDAAWTASKTAKAPSAPSPTDCCNAGPSKEQQYKAALERFVKYIHTYMAPSKTPKGLKECFEAAKKLLEGGQ